MSQIPQNFLTQIFNTIDIVINNFVENTYHNLISNNSLTITLVFTLYVAILGYRFLADSSYKADVGSITRHLVFISIIYGLIMGWGWYNKFVYSVFTNEPERISTIIINSSGQSIPGDSVLSALDAVWSKGMESARNLFAMGGFSAYQFYIYGTAVFTVTLLLCLISLGLFIYAKLAMSIMLALGPIFIIFALFKATKGFTESWIQHLFSCALIPIVTSAVIALMYSIINNTLGNLNPSSDGEMNFVALSAYSLVCSLSFILCVLIPFICSSLSGGVTLTGIGNSIRTAHSMLKNSSNSNDTKTKSVNKNDKSKQNNGNNRNRRQAQIKKMRQRNRANAAST